VYHISGNFHVIKGLGEKISRSKIFAVWAFQIYIACPHNPCTYTLLYGTSCLC